MIDKAKLHRMAQEQLVAWAEFSHKLDEEQTVEDLENWVSEHTLIYITEVSSQ